MIGKERERRRKSEKKKKEQRGTGKARNTQLKIIGFYRSGSKVPLGARDIRQRQGQSIESNTCATYVYDSIRILLVPFAKSLEI